MKNRITLATEDGLSLVQIEHLDESGNVIGVSYEVYDENGSILGEFTSLEEAKEFIRNYYPDPPSSNHGMGM